MKIKMNLVHRTIADEHILVPTGESTITYNGIFVTTEVGARIWEMLAEGKGQEEILAALREEYEVDETTLCADYHEFIQQLKESDLLEE